MRKIVQDLKDFSRVDTDQNWVWASLHDGIDSTLNIVAAEIKYRADVGASTASCRRSNAFRPNSTRFS